MSDDLPTDYDEQVRAVFDAINSDEEEEVVSVHTVSLYEDVSEGGFSDDELLSQDVNYVERVYFDSLHTADAPVNDTFSTGSGTDDGKTLTAFESQHFHQSNVTPDRPCTAYFKTESYVTAKEVFEALKGEGFASDHVRCLHRKPTGEIYITFKTQEICDAFLRTTKFMSPRAPNTFFVPQDSEKPLTFLTIYDAPYELSDEALIHRLAPYCEVMWHRRGKFAGTAGTVYNGLRHYRVCLSRPMPSYLRFGKFLVRLQYDGQNPTCRKCNRPDHKAAECRNTICFNCDGLGHEARDCIRPMYCCLCKSGQHLARDCKFSWRRAAPQTPRRSRPRKETGSRENVRADHPPEVRVSDETPVPADETPAEEGDDVTPSDASEVPPRNDDDASNLTPGSPPQLHRL